MSKSVGDLTFDLKDSVRNLYKAYANEGVAITENGVHIHDCPTRLVSCKLCHMQITWREASERIHTRMDEGCIMLRDEASDHFGDIGPVDHSVPHGTMCFCQHNSLHKSYWEQSVRLSSVPK